MKKIAFIFAALACASFLAAADFTAQVVSVSGKVEVLNGNTWKPISSGDTLKSGDTIQTGFKSGAVLKIKESTVNVAALTRMTVEQLSENSGKDNVRVFVKTGGVKSNVQKSSGKKVGFTVRTPVATASVRGTEFSVENTFDSTQVNTTRGKVAVWSGKNSERVSSDENSGGEISQGNGETAETSFENAPYGAITVSQNQGTELNSDGNVGSQRASAEENSKGDIGRGMKTPSDKNQQQGLIQQGSNPNSVRPSSLTVNVTVEN